MRLMVHKAVQEHLGSMAAMVSVAQGHKASADYMAFRVLVESADVVDRKAFQVF